MSYNPIVDEVAIGSAAIGLLEREAILARTVWRDPVNPNDFARKKNDTVSIYLPAYVTANRRQLRANAARSRKTLQERKIDVSLDYDLQVDIPLTDENLTLDVANFTLNVTVPALSAIVRAYDDEIAAVMEGATYETTIPITGGSQYEALVDARAALNDASVPATNRWLVVGSELEADLLKSELLSQANTSGSAQTLRNGVVGQVAGFNVLVSHSIAPDVGFAYHSTAFALASRAPVVPRGVAWGTVQAAGGFAVRVMEHLTDDGTGDLLNLAYFDSWFGCGVVTDNGTWNQNGKFIPSEDPSNPANDRLVRAVKIGGGAASS